MTLTTSHFLVLATVLFGIGVVGVLVRKNALIVLMAIEIMLTGANLTLVVFARQRHDMRAQALALLVIALAAAEAAVGLAIIVRLFRTTRHANVDRMTSLRD